MLHICKHGLIIKSISCLLLVEVLVWSTAVEIASDEKEYEVVVGEDTIKCPSCEPGEYRVTHCNKTEPTLCKPCPSGTFNYAYSWAPVCADCTECDLAFHLVIKSACTATTDVQCKCKEHFWRQLSSDDPCDRHKYCYPGFGAIKGTPSTNTVCTPCEYGSFSDISLNFDKPCKPWKNCQDLGLQTYQNGTAINDTICFALKQSQTDSSTIDHSVIIGIIVSIVVAAAALVVITIVVVVKRHQHQHCETESHGDLYVHRSKTGLSNSKEKKKNSRCRSDVETGNGVIATGHVTAVAVTEESRPTVENSQPLLVLQDLDRTGDDDIHDVAMYISSYVIGKEWFSFGLNLGVTKVELEQIEEKHYKDLQAKVYATVMLWRQKNANGLVEDLIKPLRQFEDKAAYADHLLQQLHLSKDNKVTTV